MFTIIDKNKSEVDENGKPYGTYDNPRGAVAEVRARRVVDGEDWNLRDFVPEELVFEKFLLLTDNNAKAAKDAETTPQTH